MRKRLSRKSKDSSSWLKILPVLSLGLACGIPWFATACGGSDSESTDVGNMPGSTGGSGGSQGPEETGGGGTAGNSEIEWPSSGGNSGGESSGGTSSGGESSGGDAGAAGDTTEPAAGAAGSPVEPEPWLWNTEDLHSGAPNECQKPIVSGLNIGWEVDGRKRSFYVDFPSNPSKAPALVYSFHGYMDNPINWKANLGLNPNFDSSFPMIVVTPVSTHLQPITIPQGLDWDLANGANDRTNRDVQMVQSILGCLKLQEGIDEDRIYSVGFSAGSVFSALLYSRFQQDFAAIVAMSGMWFNDPAQMKLINPVIPPFLSFSWNDMDPQKGGSLLLSRGGKNDVIQYGDGLVWIVSIEDAAKAAFPFLKKANRTVVDCPHNHGHVPARISQQQLVGYLKAHKRGQPSPYQGGLPSLLASSCNLRKP